MIDLRIIGDVHGHYGRYHLLRRKALHTIQVGDFGFQYDTLSSVDANKHRILGGNHDNYDDVGNWPHFLGNYGTHNVPGFNDIFFVRGGLSIDRHLRLEGISWWSNEELSVEQCYKAIEEYRRMKPRFVVSHECPSSILEYVLPKCSTIISSRTGQLLEQMLAEHRPRMWVFGHHHKSWRKLIDGTMFVCLDELECLDMKTVHTGVR